MNCPNCNVTLLISNRHEIEIDYCPQCRGVWLDRGELDKIIERSITDASKWHRHFDDDDDDDRFKSERGNHKKLKKSFLGDLFDIG